MMSANKASNIKRLVLGLCLSLAGCVSTRLGSQPIQPKIFELAALNKNPIELEVESAVDSSLGHQFVLVALPFGQVEARDLAVMTQRAAYHKLALAGFTPVIGKRPPIEAAAMLSPQWINPPELAIKVQDASASAFDFIVTRRMSCSVDLAAEFTRDGALQQAQGLGDFQHFGAFAFEQELSLCLAQALDSALNKVFHDLRIQE